MDIFGAGLSEAEVKAINTFLGARRTLKPQDRHEAGIPVEFEQLANQSKPFAFWLQIGMIRQDRPIFFHLGLAITAFAIINTIISLGLKLWAYIT